MGGNLLRYVTIALSNAEANSRTSVGNDSLSIPELNDDRKGMMALESAAKAAGLASGN